MLLPCKLTVKAIEAGQGKAAETEGGEMCKIWQNFCQKNLEYSALCPEALFANQWCLVLENPDFTCQAIEFRWDWHRGQPDWHGGWLHCPRGKVEQRKAGQTSTFPVSAFSINFLFQGLYGGQFLFAGHGMEVEDSEKHKWKWQISSWGLKGSCQKIIFRTLS